MYPKTQEINGESIRKIVSKHTHIIASAHLGLDVFNTHMRCQGSFSLPRNYFDFFGVTFISAARIILIFTHEPKSERCAGVVKLGFERKCGNAGERVGASGDWDLTFW